MISFKTEPVSDIRAHTGDGAFWSTDRQAVYWVDIPAGRLHLHDPATGHDLHWDFPTSVGCVAETRSGRIVAALTNGFHLLDPDTGNMIALGGANPGAVAHRFNDGTVDPHGRFLAGTMGQTPGLRIRAEGRLYAFDGRFCRKIVDGFRTLNGLAFSPDGRTAYISDSHPEVQTIWAYDYDQYDGLWTHGRVFFDCRNVAGRPDGGAIDSDGCYWMAGVSGWQLLRITPQGKLDMAIEMPVENPTRIAFGGREREQLFVTSIAVPGDTDQPDSGKLLTLRVPGIVGQEMPVMTFPKELDVL